MSPTTGGSADPDVDTGGSPEGGAGSLADLVNQARKGDRMAFEELVKATSAATYTLAYRLVGEEEDARDVVAGGLSPGLQGPQALPRRRPVHHLAVPDHRELRGDPARRRSRHRPPRELPEDTPSSTPAGGAIPRTTPISASFGSGCTRR